MRTANFTISLTLSASECLGRSGIFHQLQLCLSAQVGLQTQGGQMKLDRQAHSSGLPEYSPSHHSSSPEPWNSWRDVVSTYMYMHLTCRHLHFVFRIVVHKCILEHEQHVSLELNVRLDQLQMATPSSHTHNTSQSDKTLTPDSIFFLMVERSMGL